MNCESHKINCIKNICICCISAFVLILGISIILIMINVNANKSILTAVAVEGDNTQLGTTFIKFSNNDIVVGNAITHEDGSDSIFIKETGIYQISYQLFGIKQGAGSFNFNAVLAVNDVPLESTFNDGPVIEDFANNRITLTSTVILKLNSGDTLKLAGISLEDIMYEKARIDIEKIEWNFWKISEARMRDNY